MYLRRRLGIKSGGEPRRNVDEAEDLCYPDARCTVRDRQGCSK